MVNAVGVCEVSEMTQAELITAALGVAETKDKVQGGTCAICGQECEGVPVKKIVRNERFTNFDEINVDGDVVCGPCATCMKDARLRRKSFIAHPGGVIFLEKNDIEHYVFDLEAQGIKTPFLFCVTTSFKKHMFFRARLNNDYKQYNLQFEEVPVTITEHDKELYKQIQDAYEFFSKDELLTGNFKLINIKKFGIDRFGALKEMVEAKRTTAKFKFLVHIMNSEVKNEKHKRASRTAGGGTN